MTAEVWLHRKAKEFAVRSKVINTQGELLPPLSITKGRGVILQSDKYKKQIATDLRKYVVARRDQFAFDPMSLYYGAIGHVTSPEVGLVSPDYVVFDVDDSVDKSFMNFLLRSPAQVARYETVAETGNQFGKRRRVYWSVFEELEFKLPLITEQRKIAAILSSVDDAIEATQAVIDQLQVVKQAMIAELLTRGLPGRHSRFKQTEIGELPEGWNVRPFSEICTKIVDGVHKKPTYLSSGVPFVTVKNLTAVDEGISLDELSYVSQKDHTDFIRRAHPEYGDVLLTKDGTLGVPRVVNVHVPFSIFVSVAVLKPVHELIDAWFMRYALESPSVVSHFGIVNSGLAIKHIHLIDLRATPCPVPPIEEQREIAAVLQAVGDRIAAEKAAMSALRFAKFSLMSVLLTGELRVTPDPEPA